MAKRTNVEMVPIPVDFDMDSHSDFFAQEWTTQLREALEAVPSAKAGLLLRKVVKNTPIRLVAWLEALYRPNDEQVLSALRKLVSRHVYRRPTQFGIVTNLCHQSCVAKAEYTEVGTWIGRKAAEEIAAGSDMYKALLADSAPLLLCMVPDDSQCCQYSSFVQSMVEGAQGVGLSAELTHKILRELIRSMIFRTSDTAKTPVELRAKADMMKLVRTVAGRDLHAQDLLDMDIRDGWYFNQLIDIAATDSGAV